MPTVLLVDDSKFARSTAARALKQAGFTVLESADGHEALQTLRLQSVDVIVSDLIMPVLDGASFIRKLRAAGVRAPVVVFSSDQQVATRAVLAAGGVAALVPKADGSLALVAAVKTALASPASRLSA
jgi:two-component system, OmpR family, response regulator PrrA